MQLFQSVISEGDGATATGKTENSATAKKRKILLGVFAIFFVLVFLIAFRQIAEFEIGWLSLGEIAQTHDLLTTSQTYLPAALEGKSTGTLPTHIQQTLQKMHAEMQEIERQQKKSWLLNLPFAQPAKYQKKIQELEKKLADAQTITDTLLTGKHRYIILFQNSDELRATGGFMGSYSLVEVQDGTISHLEIQDIYEPDGQFHGTVDAPPGLKEYLSGGNGMRLPDANWNPDFPSSAKTILNFFALANQKDIDGVVAVNLNVAQDFLKVVGNIYLPDYKVTVTPENLPAVARADREHFFPGSQQKQNFLSALFTQMKLHVMSLTADQKMQLAKLALQKMQTKDIQAYANDESVEQVFENEQVAGEMKTSSGASGSSDNPFYLFLVESNVGINKANAGISRSVKVSFAAAPLQLTIHFQNTNDPLSAAEKVRIATLALSQNADDARRAQIQTTNGNGYVDYQRVLLLPETTVSKIAIDGQEISKWDEDIVTTSAGQQFKQIGFLVTVPEKTDRTVTLQLSHPLLHDNHPFVFIQKQSGLPPTQYIFEGGGMSEQGGQSSIVIDRDVEMQL